jgi:hypothetical protein
VAKDALHNFKIDGETKMKVGPGTRSFCLVQVLAVLMNRSSDFVCRLRTRESKCGFGFGSMGRDYASSYCMFIKTRDHIVCVFTSLLASRMGLRWEVGYAIIHTRRRQGRSYSFVLEALYWRHGFEGPPVVGRVALIIRWQAI